MATYFDPNVAADKNLLDVAYRKYDDLANLAADVEADVIQHYTVRADDQWYRAFSLGGQQGEQVGAASLNLYVMLRGYKADAAHADVDPDLKDALKRTIAEVVAWRIERRNRGQALSGTSVQGVSRAYIEEARALYPRGWDRRLRRFDLRDPVWGI